MTDEPCTPTSNQRCESCERLEAMLEGMTDTAVKQDEEIERLQRALTERPVTSRLLADSGRLLLENERLNAQWEKAARLLNEFRPVTGTDEWVAVRVSALNYVLMAASPTPAVGPLVPAPESRDG